MESARTYVPKTNRKTRKRFLAKPPKGCGLSSTCVVYTTYRHHMKNPRTAGLTQFQWSFISLILSDLNETKLLQYSRWLGVPFNTLNSIIVSSLQVKASKFIGKYSYLNHQSGGSFNRNSRRFCAEKKTFIVDPI